MAHRHFIMVLAIKDKDKHKVFKKKCKSNIYFRFRNSEKRYKE